MISVIVELKARADLQAIQAPVRRERLKKLIDALQQKADLTQTRIRVLLRRRKDQGKVADFAPYWIINGVSVTAIPVVIQELAALPEVDRIVPNATIQAPSLLAESGAPEANW